MSNNIFNNYRRCIRTTLQVITARLKEKSNAEWDVIFAGDKVPSENGQQLRTRARFPYGPVNNLLEVFQDPQVKFNQMEATMTHDTVGSIKQVYVQLLILCKSAN